MQERHEDKVRSMYEIKSPKYAQLTTPSFIQMDNSETTIGFQIPKEIVFVYAAIITLMTSGGLVFGFGPFYNVMVQEEQWAWLCKEKNDEICPDQQVKLQMVYSIGFLCLDASFTVFGIFCDVFGAKVTVLVGLMISMMGNILLAYGNETLLILGYAAVALGGIAAYLSTLQLLQLFENQGFVYAIIPTMVNGSGFIYMLLQAPGVTRKGFFLCYAFICIGFAVVSFLVYPYKAITSPSAMYTVPKLQLSSFHMTRPQSVFQEFRLQLKRPDLWFFTCSFAWLSLIFSFTGGAIPDILGNLTEGQQAKQDQVDLYINYLLPILTNATFLFAPFAGLIIRRIGFRPVFAMAFLTAKSLLICLLIKSIPAQIASFFLLAASQAFIYSLHGSYSFVCFPTSVAGSIISLTTLVSCITCTLTNALTPLTQKVFDGKYLWSFLILGVPLCLGYFFLSLPAKTEEQGKERALKYTLHKQEEEDNVEETLTGHIGEDEANKTRQQGEEIELEASATTLHDSHAEAV